MISLNGNCVCDSNYYEYNFTGDGTCTLCSSIENMIISNGKCICRERSQFIRDNNGTKSCVDLSQSLCQEINPCLNGICNDFSGKIICKCLEGYTGIYCDIENTIENIENRLSALEEEIENSIINESFDNEKTISFIQNYTLIETVKELSFLYQYSPIKKDNSLKIIKNITISAINIYNSEENTNLFDSSFKNIIEYIGLTLFYQKYSNLRRLEEEFLPIENINMLYNKLYKNNHINTNSYETSINNVVGYFLYNLSTSYTIYKNKMIEMNLPYLNNSENNIDTVLHVVKYGNVTSEKRLCEIISTFYNKEKNEIGANFKFIVNTTYNDNRDLYLYYIKRGINIFNVNDEAFTNKCYRNTELKYDLTNKYRKYSLYQGQITEHSNNNNLYYLTMEKDVSLLQLKDNYSNLPFKCLKKVSKLYQNISFWFYFILFIIVIGITVLFQFIKDDFSNSR